MLIVDGTVSFIGGAGFADIWKSNADSPDHWRDSMFKLEGRRSRKCKRPLWTIG
jgi:cardiolipin synthase